MRCAIKSVELLKITYLSLPDNMLGFAETKMIAFMLMCAVISARCLMKIFQRCLILIGCGTMMRAGAILHDGTSKVSSSW